MGYTVKTGTSTSISTGGQYDAPSTSSQNNPDAAAEYAAQAAKSADAATQAAAEAIATLAGKANISGDVFTGLVTAPGLQLNTLSPSADAVGRFTWNDTDGTANLRLKGNNVTLQVGQEQVVRIVNKSGVSLTDMQVVYVTGAQGQRLSAAAAIATSNATSNRTFAVVTEAIANNAEGFVTTSGLVRAVNTSAFAEGDALWLSTTVAGGITNVRPSAPYFAVLVGWCVVSHAVVGSIFVHVQAGYSLSELNNVIITSATEGDVLSYNNTQGLWVNQGGIARAGANTDITSLANITSMNGGQLAGLRNRVINGCMRVAQRGAVTPSLGSITAYTLDRWASYQTGAVTIVSQTSGNGLGHISALTFNGVASNTEVSLLQPIESSNCFDLAQTGFTLSAWIYSNVSKNIDLVLATPTTTRDVFAATTNLPSGSLTVSHPGTGWVKYSTTYSVANSLANAAAIQRGIRLQFRFPSCTTGIFGLTGVQLEAGTTVTPFEQRPYGMELALCQRYFEIITGAYTGYAASTTIARAGIAFRVTKRVAPALYNAVVGSGYVNNLGGNPLINGYALQYNNPNNTGMDFQVASGLTGGQGLVVNCSDLVSVTAEL